MPEHTADILSCWKGVFQYPKQMVSVVCLVGYLEIKEAQVS